MVTEIVANELNFSAPNGSEMVNASFELQSPQLVAICSDDDGLVTALADALTGQLDDLEGDLQINGESVTTSTQQTSQMISVASDLQLKPRKHIDEWVQKLIGETDHAITWDQTKQLFDAFDIDTSQRVKNLSDEQLRLMQVIIPTILYFPIIILDQEFDKLVPSDVSKVWSLLRDYAQKTNALIIMSSKKVSTMLQWADTIYYFNGGHFNFARSLHMDAKNDCVVTITGSHLPLKAAERVGARVLEDSSNKTRLFFSGNIQRLLPILEQKTITNVRIEDATIEDELKAY